MKKLATNSVLQRCQHLCFGIGLDEYIHLELHSDAYNFAEKEIADEDRRYPIHKHQEVVSSKRVV